MAKTLNLTLKVWRQENREAKGRIETYAAKDIPVDASFLEMLDIVMKAWSRKARNPSILTTTAGKASAACAP